MKRNYTFIPLLLLLIVAIVACSNNSSKSAADNDSEGDATKATVQVPQFSADSAYQYIQTQADFGPRVPNTAAHKACGEFLAKKLEEFGAKVYNQHADLVAYDNTILKARNVIGAYNPESKRRVLLCAHWDSRPYADQDADKTKHHSPILGVNDGASGVGVLLEVARQLQQQAPAIGIDIIFFDAEDYGIPYFYQGAYKNDTWCLGSQYWGRVPHVDGYNARYGILLDMVGGKNATFYKEQFSQRTAGKYVNKIWNTAHRLGFGNFFPKEKGTEVTDDHMYVYNLRQIPCVDIINYDPNCDTANLGKTARANAQTLKAIRFLEAQGALKTLPEALQQAAARRLEYPDLSLTALCGCFDPPMSKSGLSHRMKKLEALADALRQRLEEHTETEEAGA